MTTLAVPAASGMSASRLLDMPFSREGISLLEAVVIVVAFPPTGFPSFPHLRACAPPMHVAGPPQLTRPGGLDPSTSATPAAPSPQLQPPPASRRCWVWRGGGCWLDSTVRSISCF